MFRFRYETLLKHRRHEEEVLQKDLAEKKKRLDDTRQRLDRLRKSKRESTFRLQAVQKQSRRVADIVLHLTFLEKISRELERQKVSLLTVEKEHHLKRKELIESVRKRKTLEKLREKDCQAYELRLRRQETKFLDHVGVTQHIRRKHSF